ncbi:MAG: carbohydrate-binding family 9-like protein [Deltaproteobacteria bacterium]
MEHYNIFATRLVPEMKGLWDGACWREVHSLAVNCFRPESSDHRPRTLCKLLYKESRIFGIFRVEDQFVRCLHTGFQSEVWKDSCVEMFMQPKSGPEYFNFEFNCGGALLASYVTDPTRQAGRLQKFMPLTPADNLQIIRYASQPEAIDPEIVVPVVWFLEFSIPIPLLEKYTGPLGTIKGQTWRANFYKCGNETSHPHWASWMPLPARNFHDPESFGQIEFCGER